jgi:hypothetical protein
MDVSFAKYIAETRHSASGPKPAIRNTRSHFRF